MITVIVALGWAIAGLVVTCFILWAATQVREDPSMSDAHEPAERILSVGVLATSLVCIAFWPFIIITAVRLHVRNS